MSVDTKQEEAALKPVGVAYVEKLEEMQRFYRDRLEELTSDFAEGVKIGVDQAKLDVLSREIDRVSLTLTDGAGYPAVGALPARPTVFSGKAIRAYGEQLADAGWKGLQTDMGYLDALLKDVRTLKGRAVSVAEELSLSAEEEKIVEIQKVLEKEQKRYEEENNKTGKVKNWLYSNWPYVLLSIAAIIVFPSIPFTLPIILTTISAFIAAVPLILFFKDLRAWLNNELKDKSLWTSAALAFGPPLGAGVIFMIIMLGGGAPALVAAALATTFLFMTGIASITAYAFLGKGSTRAGKVFIGLTLFATVATVIAALAGKGLAVKGVLLGATIAGGPMAMIAVGLAVILVLGAIFLWQAATLPADAHKQVISPAATKVAAKQQAAVQQSQVVHDNAFKISERQEKAKDIAELKATLEPYNALLAVEAKIKGLESEIEKHTTKSAPYRAAFDLVQKTGWVHDVATLLSTPALIDGCIDGLQRNLSAQGQGVYPHNADAIQALSQYKEHYERNLPKLQSRKGLLMEMLSDAQSALQQQGITDNLDIPALPAGMDRFQWDTEACREHYEKQAEKLGKMEQELSGMQNLYAQLKGNGKGGVDPADPAQSSLRDFNGPGHRLGGAPQPQLQSKQQSWIPTPDQQKALEAGGWQRPPAPGGRAGGS